MRFRKLKKQSKTKSQNSQKNKNNVLYARNVDRIKSFITDMFMIYTPILYLITYVVMDGKDDFQASTMGPLVAVVLYGLISSILLYKFGQTPGNKAYDMKVVDAKTFKNITFFQALLRFVSFLLSATFLLGLFIGFYRKDRKSLHDLLSNTAVIVVNN
jgi:uncharacterized RDD family membrane protein YckC